MSTWELNIIYTLQMCVCVCCKVQKWTRFVSINSFCAVSCYFRCSLYVYSLCVCVGVIILRECEPTESELSELCPAELHMADRMLHRVHSCVAAAHMCVHENDIAKCHTSKLAYYAKARIRPMSHQVQRSPRCRRALVVTVCQHTDEHNDKVKQQAKRRKETVKTYKQALL